MSLFILLLMLAALIMFLLAAFGVNSGRVNLVALGLACWVGATLLGSGVAG